MFLAGEAMLDRMGTAKMRVRPMERRSARRYALDWAVRITLIRPQTETALLNGTLRDLSSTGAFVYLNVALQPNESVRISIRLPFERETWMTYFATVTRMAQSSKGSGIAVRFHQSRPTFDSAQCTGNAE